MRNDGSFLQNKLQGALKEHCKTFPCYWFRFYDSKSARGFLPAQPGDFLWLLPGQAVLIECKSSTREKTTLVSLAHHGPVGKCQLAKHKLWHRAGHPSIYLYYNIPEDRLAWHNGKDVIAKDKTTIFQGTLKALPESLRYLHDHYFGTVR